MPVFLSLLRGVNLGKRRVKMDALRALYQSLGLEDVQTCLQSGNVLFRAPAADRNALPRSIEAAIERAFGFHSDVILRTTSDLRQAVAASPFHRRPSLDPSKLLVLFLASELSPEARARILALPPVPEELHIGQRELYLYFPSGMARPTLKMASLDRALATPATGRNWNTVTQLLSLAEAMHPA
jgi:uncharacterized protein (DUF1697 family)